MMRKAYVRCLRESRCVRSYANLIAEHLKKHKRVDFGIDEDPAVESEFGKSKGMDVLLNFSLHKEGIAPFYESVRNADIAVLEENSYGTKTKDKFYEIPENEKVLEWFVVEGKQQEILDWRDRKVMSRKFALRMSKEAGWHLRHISRSFVHDGEVGSGSNTNARVISDNSVTSLFLKKLMLPTKLDADVREFVYKATVFHIGGFQHQPKSIVEEYGGPHLKDLGVESANFVITNVERKHTYVSATNDHSILLEALAFHCSKRLGTVQQALLIPADTITNNSQVSLVYNNINDRFKLYSSDDLYSAHHSLWTELDVRRVWNGYMSYGEKPEAGDLVERINGKLRVTKSLSGQPNALISPQNIIYTVDDSTGVIPAVSEITDIQHQADLLSSGLQSIKNGKPEFQRGTENFPSPHTRADEKDLYLNVLRSAKPRVYLVNSNNFSDMLKHLENPSKKSTTVGPLVVYKDSKTWKTASEYKTAVTELFSHVTNC